MRKISERGGVAARHCVGSEQADEHHGGADEGMQRRKLHGGVFAASGTPYRDEEVLGDDGDFVKDKQQEEIAA